MADAGISLILLVAFSLVLAGGSVYLVNERVSGEKLQQTLCGVNYKTYWFVAYIWDFIVNITTAVITNDKILITKFSDLLYRYYTCRDCIQILCHSNLCG